MTDSGLYGPAIMLKKADYGNFLFQWIEWPDSLNSLAGNSILPTIDGPNFYIGAYTDVKSNVFLNPLAVSVSD